MMTILGYTLIAPVSEDGDLMLYRAIRLLDSLPALLKVPEASGLSPLILRRLEHEYELARSLDPDRIARSLALKRHGSKVALVLEQGPTKTMASLLGSPMDIQTFLQIAIGITAALEERYQSAAGLGADLRRCQTQWESNGCIDRFALGEHDLSERLLIPEKLYGRKSEIEVLLAAFDRVASNGALESEQRYRMSQEIGHVGNWEYNIQTARFWGSVESKRIYGFDPAQSEFSIEEVEKCIPGRERVHQALVDLIEKGQPYNLEFEIHPRDSSTLKIIASIADLQRDQYGNPQVVLGVVHDITGRKRVEDDIRQLNQQIERRVADRTAQLEAANRELEAFAYSVSHDLRAPLRHVDGYIELLVSRCRADLNEKGLHYLDTIAASARQMGELINDLLQFSRTGRVELRQEEIDMNRTLREALAPVREACAGRAIEWVIGELPQVKGDSVLLRQVWGNLLENAVKYTRTRETARIEVDSREADGEIVFCVADNGVGFDMQYAGKLFGVFQRLHSQEELEGTGIGLANVRRIITRHGGRTWAEGNVDLAATFCFSLPRHQRRGEDDQLANPNGSRSQK